VKTTVITVKYKIGVVWALDLGLQNSVRLIQVPFFYFLDSKVQFPCFSKVDHRHSGVYLFQHFYPWAIISNFESGIWSYFLKLLPLN